MVWGWGGVGVGWGGGGWGGGGGCDEGKVAVVESGGCGGG